MADPTPERTAWPPVTCSGFALIPAAGQPGTEREQLRRALNPRPRPTAEQLAAAALRRRVALLEKFVFGLDDGGRR